MGCLADFNRLDIYIVLGILAAFAIPRLTASSEDVEYSRVKTNVSTVMADLGLYYISRGDLPVFFKRRYQCRYRH